MRRLLILVVFLSCALPAHATISYVQSDGAFTQTSSATATQTDTLTHTTTAGDNILVFLQWKTTSRNLKSVTATGCQFFPLLGNGTAPSGTTTAIVPWKNGTNEAEIIMIGSNCPAISSIVVTFSAGSVFTTQVEEYNPNILSLGQLAHASGNSASCSASITTQDANNFVVMGCAALGNAGVPTSSVGNLRDANRTGSTSSDIAGAACDNTAASPGAVTCTVAHTSGQWLAEAVELRTVNPTDPLLVDAFATSTDMGASRTGNNFKFYLPQPTLSGNAIICGWAYENGHTLTVSDSGSNTWTIAATATGTNATAQIAYVTSAATGTTWIQLAFNTTLTNFMPQVSCKETYHISALDAGKTSTVTAATGPVVAAGSITPSQANDLIFNLVAPDVDGSIVDFVTGTTQQSASMATFSSFSPIDTDLVTSFCFQDYQQGSAAAINPSCDVENGTSFNSFNGVTAAFKTDSSGTAPPATGLHIDHIYTNLMLFGTNIDRVVQFPVDGNFIGISTTNSGPTTYSFADSHQNSYTISNLQSNTLALAYVTAAAVDSSQKFYQKDLTGSGGNEFVYYDIRGAKTSSPIGCQSPVSGTGTQTDFTAGHLLNGSSFGTTQVPPLTPCVANDLVIWAENNGCGPTQTLSGPSGAVTDNVWYTGATDGDEYDFGQGHGHYVTVSTSAVNFNATMQNAACSGSGNGYSDAVWEISPAPSSTTRHRAWVIQ